MGPFAFCWWRRLGRSRASCPSRQARIVRANSTRLLRSRSFNSLGVFAKYKKAPFGAVLYLVETAGIEPASVGTLPTGLHV